MMACLRRARARPSPSAAGGTERGWARREEEEEKKKPKKAPRRGHDDRRPRPPPSSSDDGRGHDGQASHIDETARVLQRLRRRARRVVDRIALFISRGDAPGRETAAPSGRGGRPSGLCRRRSTEEAEEGVTGTVSAGTARGAASSRRAGGRAGASPGASNVRRVWMLHVGDKVAHGPERAGARFALDVMVYAPADDNDEESKDGAAVTLANLNYDTKRYDLKEHIGSIVERGASAASSSRRKAARPWDFLGRWRRPRPRRRRSTARSSPGGRDHGGARAQGRAASARRRSTSPRRRRRRRRGATRDECRRELWNCTGPRSREGRGRGRGRGRDAPVRLAAPRPSHPRAPPLRPAAAPRRRRRRQARNRAAAATAPARAPPARAAPTGSISTGLPGARACRGRPPPCCRTACLRRPTPKRWRSTGPSRLPAARTTPPTPATATRASRPSSRRRAARRRARCATCPTTTTPSWRRPCRRRWRETTPARPAMSEDEQLAAALQASSGKLRRSKAAVVLRAVVVAWRGGATLESTLAAFDAPAPRAGACSRRYPRREEIRTARVLRAMGIPVGTTTNRPRVTFAPGENWMNIPMTRRGPSSPTVTTLRYYIIN